MTAMTMEFAVGQEVGSRARMDAMPVGTRVEQAGAPIGTKQEDGTWARPDTVRPWPSSQYSFNPTFLIAYLPETPDPMQATIIPAAAVQAGMYVRPHQVGLDNVRVYVVSREDSLCRTVESVEGGAPVWQERAIDVYPSYEVLPQDAAALAMKAYGELMLATPAPGPVDVDLTEVQREARDRERAQWRTRMESLNQRLHEFAENESLDGDFDSLMTEFDHLGLTPRTETRTYSVELQITGTFRRQVTLEIRNGQEPDEDELYRIARQDAGFEEGSSYNCHGETVVIDSVSDHDWEED